MTNQACLKLQKAFSDPLAEKALTLSNVVLRPVTLYCSWLRDWLTEYFSYYHKEEKATRVAVLCKDIASLLQLPTLASSHSDYFMWPPLLWYVNLSNYCRELTFTFTFSWISMNRENTVILYLLAAACLHAAVELLKQHSALCVFLYFILVSRGLFRSLCKVR